VLTKRGPKICDVLWSVRLFAIRVFVLRTLPIVREFPVRVETANVDTLAIVLLRGNPKVLIIFHVFASLDENDIEAYDCETLRLLVPSINVKPFMVLTIIDCGDDK
jgi:hypothetical protein